MIKKYPWHLIFALLILISLANLFQKLKWSSVSDHLVWENSEHGLVCVSAPAGSQVKPGDILLLETRLSFTKKCKTETATVPAGSDGRGPPVHR